MLTSWTYLTRVSRSRNTSVICLRGAFTSCTPPDISSTHQTIQATLHSTAHKRGLRFDLRVYPRSLTGTCEVHLGRRGNWEFDQGLLCRTIGQECDASRQSCGWESEERPRRRKQRVAEHQHLHFICPFKTVELLESFIFPWGHWFICDLTRGFRT